MCVHVCGACAWGACVYVHICTEELKRAECLAVVHESHKNRNGDVTKAVV